MSQPTISTQIRELEKHLGVVVVERVGRGVAMTAAGRELAERGRAILRDTDELVESGHRSATALIGPLRLAAIPTAAPYLLPRVLPAIRGRHPEAEMHLSETRTAELTAALAAAEIDLGIIALPVDDARIACAKILDDYFLLAIAASHPLALQSQVPIGSLEDETVLLLEDGHCLRDHVRDICDRAGARGGGSIQGTSLATVCQMVAAGMGVTLMPASARAVEARDGTGLVVRPLQRCRSLPEAGPHLAPQRPRRGPLPRAVRDHGNRARHQPSGIAIEPRSSDDGLLEPLQRVRPRHLNPGTRPS